MCYVPKMDVQGQGGASSGNGTVSELLQHNMLEYYAAIKNSALESRIEYARRW